MARHCADRARRPRRPLDRPDERLRGAPRRSPRCSATSGTRATARSTRASTALEAGRRRCAAPGPGRTSGTVFADHAGRRGPAACRCSPSRTPLPRPATGCSCGCSSAPTSPTARRRASSHEAARGRAARARRVRRRARASPAARSTEPRAGPARRSPSPTASTWPRPSSTGRSRRVPRGPGRATDTGGTPCPRVTPSTAPPTGSTRPAPGASSSAPSCAGPRCPTSTSPGSRTLEVVARGKHLLHRFDTGATLHTHLRMEGQWRVEHPGAATERALRRTDLRAAVLTDAWSAARPAPRDARPRPHRARGRPRRPPRPRRARPRLGPAPVAAARLTASRGFVGDALLDQRVLAGVGTFWASEILFIERVLPWTPARDLDRGRARGCSSGCTG